MNDLDLCLAQLFLEVSILIGFFFTTNRNNKAIEVGNFVYYLKNETSDENKRWVCNRTGCSASVTTLEAPNARSIRVLMRFSNGKM